MRISNKIRIIAIIVLGGLVISMGNHAYMSSRGLGYPYNTFRCCPGDQFNDFFNHFRYSIDPYHLNSPDPNHFPFLYVILRNLRDLPRLVLFIPFMTIFLSGLFFAVARIQNLTVLDRAVLISTFLLSYPVLMGIDRGNFELLLFVLIFLFCIWYPRHPQLAAGLLVVACVIKPFPAVFFLLLLADRHYKLTSIAAGLVIIITLLSYTLLPGGLLENLRLHLVTLSRYTQVYAMGLYGFIFGSSLFGAVRFLAVLISPSTPLPQIYAIVYFPYLLLSGLIGVLLALTLYFEKTYWKRVLLLVLLMVLLPWVTADYRLIHFITPLLLFIELHDNDQNRKYLLLIALLMIPKDFLRLGPYPDVSVSVLLNPVIMLILAGIVIRERILLYLEVINMKSKQPLLPDQL